MNNTAAVLHPKCASEYRVLSELTPINAEAYKLFRTDPLHHTPLSSYKDYRHVKVLKNSQYAYDCLSPPKKQLFKKKKHYYVNRNFRTASSICTDTDTDS